MIANILSTRYSQQYHTSRRSKPFRIDLRSFSQISPKLYRYEAEEHRGKDLKIELDEENKRNKKPGSATIHGFKGIDLYHDTQKGGWILKCLSNSPNHNAEIECLSMPTGVNCTKVTTPATVAA